MWQIDYYDDVVPLVHTWPVDDIIEHYTNNAWSELCPCLPRVEHLERPDGVIAWHIIHNAWDERE
jgi:hypothetical protein